MDSVTEADLDMEDRPARSRPASRARSRASRPSSASSTRSTRSTRSMLVEDELSGCLVSSEDGLLKAAVSKRPHEGGSSPSGAVGGGIRPSKIPCPPTPAGASLRFHVDQAGKGPSTSAESRRADASDDDVVFVRPQEVSKGKNAPKSDPISVAAFSSDARYRLSLVLNRVKRCGNLKGTDQRAMTEEIGTVMALTEALDPNSSVAGEFSSVAVVQKKMEAEAKELRKQNKELQSQIRQLQEQIRQLAEVVKSGSRTPPTPSPAPKGSAVGSASGPAPAPGDTETLRADIMRATGVMIEARIGERIEQGIREIKAALGLNSPATSIRPEHRPPLQSDGQYDVLSRIPGAGGPGFRDAPHLRGARGAAFPPLGASQPVSRPASGSQQPGPSGMARQDGWSTVVKRGGKTRNVPERQTQSTQSTQRSSGTPSQGKKGKAAPPSPSKLRAPRSAAVVVTLCPEAEAAGVTYSAVLKEAKDKIDLASLGIGSLRFKTAATGARILEIPGSQTGDQADALASKFRDVFPDGTVRIARPTKTAEMRVMGLDDER
ncbi:uncharacterized protein LOC131846908 [Achroia grisella]|uniref:uncharacterized protein LOC131846908 n=1 Tax=Achroia grisella TaxID=688607 RepID=UPI0027D2A714|nr:uncharacterized protein LOC131846908 [Achroia grisella]